MKKQLICIGLLLIMALAFAAKEQVTISDFEMEVLQETNLERAKYGLKPLIFEAGLAALAKRHSQNMHQYDFFAHRDIWGDEVAGRKQKYYPGLIVMAIGENLGRFSSPKSNFDARDLVNGWMNSPLHRDQILDENYTHLGVGVSVKKGVLYATQNFATPLVRICSEAPPQVKHKQQYTMRFEYLSDLDKDYLGATLLYPNKKTKYKISDHEEMVGAQPIAIKWLTDNILELTVPFNAGKGNYKLCFGYGGGYFEEGIVFKAE